MKKLLIVGAAMSLGMVAGFLVVSPTALAAIAGAAPPGARNLERTPPSGTYLNVEAGYGSAEIRFFADGRYTFGDDGSVAAEGTFQVTGNQIVFIEYGPADAACLHLPGRYAWAFDGKVLTLKAVEERCATRLYDWGSGEWFSYQH